MWLFIKRHFNKCRTLHGTETALGEQQRSHNQHVGARLSSCSYRRRRAKHGFTREPRKNAALLFTSNLFAVNRQTERSDSLRWAETCIQEVMLSASVARVTQYTSTKMGVCPIARHNPHIPMTKVEENRKKKNK